MQTYQRVGDQSEGDFSSDPDLNNFSRDLSLYARNSTMGPFSGHLNTAADVDIYAFMVANAGTNITVLPDLMNYYGTLMPETSVDVAVWELVYQTDNGLYGPGYHYNLVNATESNDTLAAAYAARLGLNSALAPFTSYTTQHAAGEIESIHQTGFLDYTITHTGQYLVQVSGSPFDIAALVPGSAATNQQDAGRYLIAFGNPTGQRALAWGSGWINQVEPTPEAPLLANPTGDIYVTPAAGAWSSLSPGTYGSPQYTTDPLDGTMQIADPKVLTAARPEELAELDNLSQPGLISTVTHALINALRQGVMLPILKSAALSELLRGQDGAKLVLLMTKGFEGMFAGLEQGAASYERGGTYWDPEAVYGPTRKYLADFINWNESSTLSGYSKQLMTATVNARLYSTHSDVSFTAQQVDQNPVYQAPEGHTSSVLASAGGDTLIGSSGTDILLGNSGNDIISAGAGNDLLGSGGGKDMIDGGNGNDQVYFEGLWSEYTLTRSGDTFTVSQGGAGMSATLTAVERLQFLDQFIAIDIAGVGGQAYRLYRAAFDRTPDQAGVGYWIAQMDRGADLTSVANAFTTSAEFISKYGANPDHADLVKAFYVNILHRAPEPAGQQYWTGALDNGVPIATVLANISESAENVAASVSLIGNGFAYVPYH